MVLGFGEIIFPALPPPIIASKIEGLLKSAFFAIAIAIGATVITEISINTPTAQIIIVATATETKAYLCPNFCTITSAIFSAEPVLIRAPAKIPDVSIRSTEDIILWAPATMVSTVVTRPPPPTNPPIKAPRIKLYAG